MGGVQEDYLLASRAVGENPLDVRQKILTRYTHNKEARMKKTKAEKFAEQWWAEDGDDTFRDAVAKKFGKQVQHPASYGLTPIYYTPDEFKTPPEYKKALEELCKKHMLVPAE